MTAPLYSDSATPLLGVRTTKNLMGAVVVYLPAPENPASVLIAQFFCRKYSYVTKKGRKTLVTRT